MTIKYADGRTMEAVILSRDDKAIRAAVIGGDDAVLFTCVNGTWVSEDCEPVELQFEWQRQSPKAPVSVADCICSQELADRLILALFSPGENEFKAPIGPARLKPASGSLTGSATIH